MAKMFYSLEEAAQRLGKTVADVRAMAQRGEITEFRDGDRLIFKVDQIDLLAGDEGDANDMSSMIPLADSGSGMALGLTDTGSGAPIRTEDTKEKTGISVFDAEDLDADDPSAQTQISDEPNIDNVSLESFGSGSGLMDLTRESDDTSLGAEGLLDELYTPGGTGAGSAAGTRTGTGGGESAGRPGDSGLFEGAASTTELVGVGAGEGAALVNALPEAYDGKSSGLVGGLSIGAIAALGLGLFAVLMGMMGQTPGFFTQLFDGNILIWVAALAGLTIVLGGVGFAISKKD